jgi:hypothetical protein
MQTIELERTLDQIMVDAEADLTHRTEIRFTSSQVTEIISEARRRLIEIIDRDDLHSIDEVRAAWRHLVYEFHIKRYWGFAETNPEDAFANDIPALLGPWSYGVVATFSILGAALFYSGFFETVWLNLTYGRMTAIAILPIIGFAYLAWRYRNMTTL